MIAQIRFPTIIAIERRDFVAAFQEAIRPVYPVLRPEEHRSVVLGGPQGVVDTRTTISWRFLDAAGSWRVTLAPEFLAVETHRYTSRNDLLDRVTSLLEALNRHVAPQVIDRLGIRYINRLSDEVLMRDLPRLLRPEVSGILGTPLAQHAHHALSESLFLLPEEKCQLTARWGLIPANGTADPAAVEPLPVASWLLDLDAFRSYAPENTHLLDPVEIVEQMRTFAERIYSVFRWAVTDELLRRCGGQP